MSGLCKDGRIMFMMLMMMNWSFWILSVGLFWIGIFDSVNES